MCYTSSDSRNAYIINIISSLLLLSDYKDYDTKILAYFFLFVGQMQLFDYIFWKNQECNIINKTSTKFAIIFNHLQPIILYLLIKYYGYQQSKLSTIIIILYIIVAIKYTSDIWPNINCDQKEPVCCSLVKNDIIYWQWNDQYNNLSIYILFLLSLVVSSFDLQNKQNQIIFSFASVITFFVSLKIPKLNQSSGRIWCYMASLIPLFIYIKKKISN